MILDRGYRKVTKLIIIGKENVTHRAIRIAADESLWFFEVPHLSLSFPIYLVDHDVLRVRQNGLYSCF